VCAERERIGQADAVRGVDRDWVEQLYSFAVHPDITFYFRVPLEISLARILDGRPALYRVAISGGEARRVVTPQDGSDPDWSGVID